MYIYHWQKIHGIVTAQCYYLSMLFLMKEGFIALEVDVLVKVDGRAKKPMLGQKLTVLTEINHRMLDD